MITKSVASVVRAKKIQEVVTVAPTATVAEAVHMMASRDVGAVIVRADAGKIEGIFTERDLMCRVVDEHRAPESTPISSVMSPFVRHVDASATIQEALRLMVEHGYRHLLVEDKSALLGVLSIRDLMAALVLPDEPIASEGRVGVVRSRAEDAVRTIQQIGKPGVQ